MDFALHIKTKMYLPRPRAAPLPHGNRMLPLALVLAFVSPGALATPVCRWVDASGQTHVADTVPSAYQAGASCTDSDQFELTPAQQRDAERRTADEQFRARNLGVLPPAGAASGLPRAPRSAKRPTDAITDATDCPTWWRIYDESSACFGPFRTTSGSLKPEALDQCNEVPSPELKCGPRRH